MKSTLYLTFAFVSLNLPLAYSQTQSEEHGLSLGNMIMQGGWAMIPLLVCSLTLLYLLIQSYRDTKATDFGSEALAHKFEDLCKEGNIVEAIDLASKDPSVLGRALAKALPKLESRSGRQNVDRFNSIIAEIFETEEQAISQRIHYINVVAAVAPMIGLLGTVSGMIGAFQTMSAGGMGRPELLAGDIGEALITTATGLCIGIPAMVAFSYFSNRLENQLVENSQRANEIGEVAQKVQSD